MRIFVLIKQTPETRSMKMDEKTGTVTRNGVDNIVNPLDLYAVEVALQLKDKFSGETAAISMGPPAAESALREVVSMGIEKVFLVCDKTFAGSDTWATSYTLGNAIQRIGKFDLIICGERAIDGDTGQVGPETAAYLGVPVVAYVNKVHEVTGNEIKVSRLVENGEEIVSVKMPALLTVVKETAEPRLPTLDGKIHARDVEVIKLSAADLNIDPKKVGLEGSPTRVVKISKPQITRKCEMHKTGNKKPVSDAVESLVNFLNRMESVSE